MLVPEPIHCYEWAGSLLWLGVVRSSIHRIVFQDHFLLVPKQHLRRPTDDHVLWLPPFRGLHSYGVSNATQWFSVYARRLRPRRREQHRRCRGDGAGGGPRHQHHPATLQMDGFTTHVALSILGAVPLVQKPWAFMGSEGECDRWHRFYPKKVIQEYRFRNEMSRPTPHNKWGWCFPSQLSISFVFAIRSTISVRDIRPQQFIFFHNHEMKLNQWSCLRKILNNISLSKRKKQQIRYVCYSSNLNESP